MDTPGLTLRRFAAATCAAAAPLSSPPYRLRLPMLASPPYRLRLPMLASPPYRLRLPMLASPPYRLRPAQLSTDVQRPGWRAMTRQPSPSGQRDRVPAAIDETRPAMFRGGATARLSSDTVAPRLAP